MAATSQRFNFKLPQLALAIILVSPFALADGRVSGRVGDQRGQVFFEGAVVRINSLKLETATKRGGRFSFSSVPAGTYELSVSYLGADTVRQSITIRDDQVTSVSVKIGEDVKLTENVIVIGQAASASRALNQMRAADNLVSVVTSDSIGQLPDENVSEALQRVPGVFIVRDQGEGRFVGVRGIDPNLNSSSINGLRISAPESGSRAVALDVIPSELVESLEVSKTLTPDMDGEAIGGSININSLSGFDRDGLFYRVSANANYSDLEEEDGYKFSGTVTNVFDLATGELALAASYSNQERVFGSDNIEAGSSWSDDFADAADNEFIAQEEFEPRDYQITREREGFALNLDYRPSDDTLLYSRYLYSLFSDQEFRNRFEYKFDDGSFPAGSITNTSLLANNAVVERELKDRFEEQEIQSLLLGAETSVGRWDLEGKIGLSEASEEEPDRIDAQFENDDVAQVGYTSIGKNPNIVISPDGLEPANYTLNEITVEDNFADDDQVDFTLDAKYNLNFGDNPGFIKFGLAMRQREKSNDGNSVVYEGDFMENSSWADFAGGDLDFAFADLGPSIEPGRLRSYVNANLTAFEINDIDTQIARANDFTIDEDVSAAYIMSQVDIDDIRLTYGVRVEETELEAEGNNVIAVEDDTTGDRVDISPNQFDSSYTEVLPSVNLRYDIGDDLVFRAAYFRSIGRPTFGDLRPTHEDVELTIEGNEGTLVVESAGNPELDPFTADNVDFSIEYYSGGIGVLSAGIFYKSIDDFIFRADLADSVDISRYFDFSALNLDNLEVEEFVIAQNGDDGEIFGMELAWTRAFESGLLLQANATFADSEGFYPERDGEDLPLVNQSDTVANLVIGYEIPMLSVRLSSAYQSKRLVEVASSTFNDLYEDEQLRVDFSAKVNASDKVEIFFNAKNLTDEPFYTYHGNTSRNGQFEEYGISYELGITYRNQ